jgi:hypothetical protein
MATKGGQVGNQNAAKGNQWKTAIENALSEYEDHGSQVKKGQALRAIAKEMIKQAVAGDKDARKEIGDRLDGKPVQAIAGPDGGPLTIEILRFANPDPE